MKSVSKILSKNTKNKKQNLRVVTTLKKKSSKKMIVRRQKLEKLVKVKAKQNDLSQLTYADCCLLIKMIIIKIYLTYSVITPYGW